MYYRALHTISTQRYRLPVRRYILDLFAIELDQDVVLSLKEYAVSLRAPASYKPHHSPSNRVVSVLGPLGRSRRASDSDEEVEDEEHVRDPPTIVVQDTAISLDPINKVIGFAM